MVYNFAARLEECMSQEEAFLNRKLTLSELALRVGTNRTYLSNYINQTLHLTFFDYINSWRLNYAKDLLVTTNLKLVVIAERSGFNSLSTFRRCFLHQFNLSPSAGPSGKPASHGWCRWRSVQRGPSCYCQTYRQGRNSTCLQR